MLAVGLMSGTSMDGIDATLLETDGENYIKELASYSLRYRPEFQRELKLAESAVRAVQGDLKAIKINLSETIHQSTQLHIEVVKQLLAQENLTSDNIDVIGYHGQTLYHYPGKGMTVQVGDAKVMAEALRTPVIYDLRQNDIDHGGQGAPLVPVFHHTLLQQQALNLPAVVVNCGGIANASWITKNPDNMLGFDTGPGNVLLDTFVRAQTQDQEAMDKDGHYALAGEVQVAALDALYNAALYYYQKAPPKSADAGDFTLPDHFNNLLQATTKQHLLQNGCATLAQHTTRMIIAAVQQHCGTINVPWILAGGGWNNPALFQALTQQLAHLGVSRHQVQTATQLGWNNDALEAQAIAYCAVRHCKKLPITYPGTTGVDKPRMAGKVVGIKSYQTGVQ